MPLRAALLVLALTAFLTATLLAQQDPGEKASAAVLIRRIIEDEGINRAIHAFLDLKSDISREVYFDEGEFSSLGDSLLSAGRIEEAINVFKMNTMLFPESGSAFESLGEGYMLRGDRKRAIENYEKALELKPDSENAVFILSRMNGHIHDARAETWEPMRYKPGESTGLEGDYFAQEPPGLTPEVFAPGIVSTRGNFEFSLTLTPDGKEVYFSRRGSGLMGCRYEENGWTAPQRPAFLTDHPGAFEPHISYDGEKMFFGDGAMIWVAERTGGGWGEPKEVMQGMYATTTDDGTIYVTDINPPPEFGKIVKARPINGKYAEPEPIGGGVNLPVGSAHPCIAPDESFIVFDSVVQGGGEGDDHTDLFVCFRQKDGSWGDAMNLGPGINTPGGNMCASLSPDGKYLFFQRYRDIYWVSMEVIEQLRPE